MMKNLDRWCRLRPAFALTLALALAVLSLGAGCRTPLPAGIIPLPLTDQWTIRRASDNGVIACITFSNNEVTRWSDGCTAVEQPFTAPPVGVITVTKFLIVVNVTVPGDTLGRTFDLNARADGALEGTLLTQSVANPASNNIQNVVLIRVVAP